MRKNWDDEIYDKIYSLNIDTPTNETETAFQDKNSKQAPYLYNIPFRKGIKQNYQT